MQITENLKWCYAIQKSDPSKKVSPEDIERLRKVMRLSATSDGLQLYKVFIISEPEIRKELLPASRSQNQITDAFHLIILCHYTETNASHVDKYAVTVGYRSPEDNSQYLKKVRKHPKALFGRTLIHC